MLQVITGRFHPHLESALVAQILQAKSADPFVPLAVLVPSTPLLDRIKRFLALERQHPLLNVHLLTFHQLALRLAEEARHFQSIAPPRLVEPLFFERLVRYLVRNRLSALTALRHIGHSSGTWGALWSTIRDLNDAGVDPSAALRGLDEGCFEQEDSEWLRALFSLHAAVKEASRTLEIGAADDLAQSLLPAIPASRFLASLRHIFYYGFYDLTQVQLSLFETLSAVTPTTLFFPLEEGSSFGFARRFFDRYVHPLVTNQTALTKLATSASTTSVTLSIHSVIGVDEELAATCRAILDLVETNGYRFDEIGVVARMLDPYRMALQSIFDRHRVPFTTTAGRPLIHEPVCKLLLQLASLPTNDGYRATVLDIVTSPHYAAMPDHRQSPHYRPEQWKLIVQALQITHGGEEWKRLEQASGSTLAVNGEEDESNTAGPLNIAPDVIGLLWHLVSQLLEACETFPQRGTVGQLLDAFLLLIYRHVPRPRPEEADNHDPRAARLVSTWDAIDQVWATVRELDAIGEEMTWAEFTELLTHAFERMSAPIETRTHQGVMVLDAMAARGLPFQALFIIGLNEKVFPRYIREDAFLRDRHRRVLETTLGFKIDEKLAGYDEESLLFSLLCQAATSRLSLSFQRADDAGRLLASSPYVAEAARRLGLGEHPVERIARRVTDRLAQRPSMQRFLPPTELAQWMAMSGQSPTDLLQAVGQDGNLFRHAADALDLIEDDRPVLTPFDGLTGPLDAHWSRVVQRGMAPTPLERYARCPFQYFAADVLKLEPLRLPITQALDALLLGTLCHAALRRCYELLVPTGWPVKPVAADLINQAIATAVTQAAQECETRQQTGHYLLWELAKNLVTTLAKAAVDADQAAQVDEPYTPIAFEVDAEGALSEFATEKQLALKVHGRVDRIDRHRESGALRVIDYKFKAGRAMTAHDRNLPQSAVRGYRLQPPLYASLDLPEKGRPGQVQFYFLAPQWPAPIARSTFDAALMTSNAGSLIHRTLKVLTDGIQAGRFFIVPDSYCQTCEYRVACRREHQSTWWRAHRAAEPKTITALRTIRVNDE